MEIQVDNAPVAEVVRLRRGRQVGDGAIWPFRKCTHIGDTFFAPLKGTGWARTMVATYNRRMSPAVFIWNRDTVNGIQGIRIQRKS